MRFLLESSTNIAYGSSGVKCSSFPNHQRQPNTLDGRCSGRGRRRCGCRRCRGRGRRRHIGQIDVRVAPAWTDTVSVETIRGVTGRRDVTDEGVEPWSQICKLADPIRVSGAIADDQARVPQLQLCTRQERIARRVHAVAVRVGEGRGRKTPVARVAVADGVGDGVLVAVAVGVIVSVAVGDAVGVGVFGGSSTELLLRQMFPAQSATTTPVIPNAPRPCNSSVCGAATGVQVSRRWSHRPRHSAPWTDRQRSQDSHRQP